MIYKPNFEETRRYFRAFWNKEVIDRPLIAVTAPKNCKAVPVPYLAGAKEGDFLPYLKQYDEYASNTYFAGESIPSYEISLGPDQFAAFFGGKIEYTAGTSWVGAFWDDNWEDRKITLDTSKGSVFDRLMSAIKQAAEYADGRFLINMIDLHSNMDALSAARGPQDLCMDLYDFPDEIEQAVKAVTEYYPFIVESVARAGNMDKLGYIGWSPTYCEERFAVLQCDFSCMISPDMVRRFVIPSLEKEASALRHNVYHYDGKEALGHIDDILAIKSIDVIQWVPGDGNPRSIEWMDLLHKIQSAGKGLWIYDWTPDEIINNFKRLKPEGLIFQTYASTPEEADRLIESVRKRF